MPQPLSPTHPCMRCLRTHRRAAVSLELSCDPGRQRQGSQEFQASMGYMKKGLKFKAVLP